MYAISWSFFDSGVVDQLTGLVGSSGSTNQRTKKEPSGTGHEVLRFIALASLFTIQNLSGGPCQLERRPGEY